MNPAAGGATAYRTLTRHFFVSFFRLSFLDDAGEESFKRAIFWLLAGGVAIGLFLTRLFATKYAGLSSAASIDAVVTADRLLIIVLPTFRDGARHGADRALRVSRRNRLSDADGATLFAIGLALAVNSVIGSRTLAPRWAIRAVLGVPFTLMAGAVVGLRMAMLLPTNLKAAWIFRFTEQEHSRHDALDAVRRVFFTTGVLLPAALTVPLHAVLLDARTAFACSPIVLLVGWIFTEVVCLDWRRIPFTCTVLFAKRPPAYGFLVVLTIFGWFVFAGTTLLDNARRGIAGWLWIVVILAAAGLVLRWHRMRNWGRWPLEFEDYLPDSFSELRLGD